MPQYPPPMPGMIPNMVQPPLPMQQMMMPVGMAPRPIPGMMPVGMPQMPMGMPQMPMGMPMMMPRGMPMPMGIPQPPPPPPSRQN